MSDRTTSALIEKLGDDVRRCHDGLLKCIDQGEREKDGTVLVDYEYHGRQLIRSILAYVEAVTFSVKISSVKKCLDAGIAVSDHERYAAVKTDTDLNDQGEIVERPAKLRLASNVRFAFRLLERAKRGRFKFDASAAWWSDLKSTIRVRDRLTHPRMPEDIDVTPNELLAALRAKDGFEELLLPKNRRKTPNKAPEPTTMAVTPRAIS